MEMLVHGNALLALGAAVLWGGGDFSGGMGVKNAGGSMGAALRVVLLSHAMSFSVLLTAAWLRHDAFPHGAPLAWGIAAGVAGAGGSVVSLGSTGVDPTRCAAISVSAFFRRDCVSRSCDSTV